MPLKFVPRGPINNIASLVQIMSWCGPGDKPLFEPMMVRLLKHIRTRPQWDIMIKHHFTKMRFPTTAYFYSTKVCDIHILYSTFTTMIFKSASFPRTRQNIAWHFRRVINFTGIHETTTQYRAQCRRWDIVYSIVFFRQKIGQLFKIKRWIVFRSPTISS